MAAEVALPRWSAYWNRLRRLPVFPVAILVALVFISIFASYLTSYSPYEMSLPERLLPPVWFDGGSSAHILGTDTLGRDLLTRLLYGARITLLAAVLSLVVAGGVGLVAGLLSGYLGGRTDTILMRTVDANLALPSILLALILAVTLGPSLQTVVIAIAVVEWARFARIIRGEALTIRERDFVAQAKICGASPVRILAVHLFPNVLNTFLVLLSLDVGRVVIMAATLSFLGAGIPSPTPSWGLMVSEGREYIDSAWWLAIIPGLAIAVIVLAFNLLGDWLRDTFDPKLRQL